MSKYVSAPEVAKLIRTALKKEFPTTKFSVRSDRYSGGSSIDIHWTDGPSVGQVDRVTWIFAGATFDGMTDCMDYHYRLQLVDGSIVQREEWDCVPEGAEEVRFAADFIFKHRTYSADMLAKVAARTAERFGFDAPEVKLSWDGVNADYAPTGKLITDRWFAEDLCCQAASSAIRVDGGIIYPK